MLRNRIQRRVFDCFTFLDELEILELRLGYLSDLIDIFIIAQATKTHRGASWLPILDENHPLIKKFQIGAEFRFTFPTRDPGSIWGREKEQRSSLDLALSDLKANDIVFVSDLDEIPSREQINQAKASDELRHCVPMKTSVNAMNLESVGFWTHGRVATGKRFLGAQELRMDPLLPKLGGSPGHHLTVLRGELGWKRKFEITPHQEMVINTQNLKHFLERDLYPSKDLIKYWGGGLLRRVKREKYDDFYQFAWRLRRELFLEGKLPYKLHERYAFIAYVYLFSRVNPQRDLVRIPRSWLLVYSPALVSIYICFFPLRLHMLLTRKAKIRSRIRKFLRAVKRK